MLPILTTLAGGFYLARESAQTSSKANRKCYRAQGSGSHLQPMRGRRLCGQGTASCAPRSGSSALLGLKTPSSLAGSLSCLTSSFYLPTCPGIASIKTTCSQTHVSGSASKNTQTKTPGKDNMIWKIRLELPLGEKKDWFLAACSFNISVTLVTGFDSSKFQQRFNKVSCLNLGTGDSGVFHSLLYAHHILKLNLYKVRC